MMNTKVFNSIYFLLRELLRIEAILVEELSVSVSL